MTRSRVCAKSFHIKPNLFTQTPTLSLPVQGHCSNIKHLIQTFSEDSLAVVKPSMVVMGRDGRPVHRFEVMSSFIAFCADVRTMGITRDEQLDGRPDNRTDV